MARFTRWCGYLLCTATLAGVGAWTWLSYRTPMHGQYVLVATQNADGSFSEWNFPLHIELNIGYFSAVKTTHDNREKKKGCVMVQTLKNLSVKGATVDFTGSSLVFTPECALKDQEYNNLPSRFYYRNDGKYLLWTDADDSSTEKYQVID
jgi:hypothetical protein